MEFAIIGIWCIVVALAVVLLVKMLKMARKVENLSDVDVAGNMEKLRRDQERQQQTLRGEIMGNIQSSIGALSEILQQNQRMTGKMQAEKFDDMIRATNAQYKGLEERLKTFEITNEQKLDQMRATMEKRLQYIQQDNNEKLDEMRKTVDEKLQKTLEDKMTQSFRLVNERLEQVYKGLGEMQTLAVGVGDLKKVLSNVKTRGILGEIQLDAILKEILAPDQYEMNVATVPNSKNRVEFAVKLPGEDERPVYLPIDSKFPGDAYTQLQEAYDSGSAEAVNAAFAVLSQRIKAFAKDIRDKYIEPPYTTEFAVMFLPFEGLYAEVVNRGLVEVLQREYRVNIAGPSTMAALLNSLQMGFRTIAIQKRSGEVWEILGAVKTEFDKFGDILAATQQRLDQANKELDKLVGVRTRAIQRKLRSVEKLDSGMAERVLEES